MATSAPAKETAPNRTLYIRNLPDKLPKQDLKRCLYMLFATYGVILDVVALKTLKMRGQAHVVFRDMDAATQAMRALQAFSFCGKDLFIAYAKTKSDTIAKLDGTYKMPEPERDPADNQAAIPAFAAPAARAVPVNDAVKGQKRARDDDDDDDDDDGDDDDAEMEMDVSDDDSD